MKTSLLLKKNIIPFLFIAGWPCLSFAQKPVNDSIPVQVLQTKRANVVFGELLGNGIFVSANYDFRFASRQDGLGMRVGLGFFPIPSLLPAVTVPVTINYLMGKSPHFFETALGATYLTARGFDAEKFISSVIIMPGIGYRYQHANKGFTMRLTFSPVITSSFFLFGGISFGRNF